MALSLIAAKQIKETEKQWACAFICWILPHESIIREDTIPHLGYDNEYTIQRFISIQQKSLQQSMWAFFHGMDAKRR
jgi:hypothetical protein